jgi:hypothetical protein
MISRCDVCGKFKRPEDLVARHIPDTPFSYEETWSVCRKCQPQVEPWAGKRKEGR